MKPTVKSVNKEDGKWVVKYEKPGKVHTGENVFIQSITKNGKRFKVTYHTELEEEE